MMEAIFAVTPSETIKCVRIQYFYKKSFEPCTNRTKLIDDAKRPNPQYRGLLHGTVSIVKQEGAFRCLPWTISSRRSFDLSFPLRRIELF